MRDSRNIPSRGTSTRRGSWVGRGLVWSGMEITDPKEFCESRGLEAREKGNWLNCAGL